MFDMLFSSIKEDSAIFYVEPQGGEDAELHFLDKGKKCQV